MTFDHFITVANGVITADPVAAPANVPDSHVVNLRIKDPTAQQISTRIIVGLEAPLAENVDLELYLLDSGDEAAAVAARHWYRVAVVPVLGGGRVHQTRLDQGHEGVVGGGLLYVRITGDALTAARRIGVRSATS